MADAKTYIAIAPLYVGGYTRAHNPGDVVPAENVERNGWQDGVAREGTKAANDALGVAADEAAPPPVPNPAK